MIVERAGRIAQKCRSWWAGLSADRNENYTSRLAVSRCPALRESPAFLCRCRGGNVWSAVRLSLNKIWIVWKKISGISVIVATVFCFVASGPALVTKRLMLIKHGELESCRAMKCRLFMTLAIVAGVLLSSVCAAFGQLLYHFRISLFDSTFLQYLFLVFKLDGRLRALNISLLCR